MVPACATDTDRQIRLPLFGVGRKERLKEADNMGKEGLRLRLRKNILRHRLVET